MSSPRVEKAYEKYAWVLIFVGGIVGLIFAFYFLFISRDPDPTVTRNLTGRTWDELIASDRRVADYMSYLLRFWGLFILGVATLVMFVSATAYRRGEKWAWFALWYAPFLLGLSAALNGVVGGGTLWPLFVLLLVLSLLGLLLPYRKFFPEKTSRLVVKG